MKLIKKKEFECLPFFEFEKQYNQKVADVKNHRQINELHISDDCYITFGTDVLCVLFKDKDEWKIKRKFNFYDFSFKEFLCWLRADDWERLSERD